jgi:hypothetical protein
MEQIKYVLDNVFTHTLVGIGDFSHGIKEIWKLRIKVIEELLKHDKKIVIFQEDTINSIKNIYEDNKLKIYKSESYRKKFPLMRYGYKIYSSKEYLYLIKLLRANRDKIIMYGVDTQKPNRDKDMFDNILKKIDNNGYNLFFGHNFHIDARKPKWMKIKTTGYYLSKYLKKKYKIILSCGIKGKVRYDGIDNDIKEKSFSKSFYTKSLKNLYNKKYITKFTGSIYETGWSWSDDGDILAPIENVDIIVFDKVSAL